jgi:hypothetical protein
MAIQNTTFIFGMLGVYSFHYPRSLFQSDQKGAWAVFFTKSRPRSEAPPENNPRQSLPDYVMEVVCTDSAKLWFSRIDLGKGNHPFRVDPALAPDCAAMELYDQVARELNESTGIGHLRRYLLTGNAADTFTGEKLLENSLVNIEITHALAGGLPLQENGLLRMYYRLWVKGYGFSDITHGLVCRNRKYVQSYQEIPRKDVRIERVV